MDSIFNDNFMSTWIADKIEESQRYGFDGSKNGDGYDFKSLADSLDFIVPMAYDECWGTDVANGNSQTRTNIYGIQQYIELGVPTDKLVVGFPWYGWKFTCDSTPHDDEPCKIKDSGDEDW
ncbi:hypothetical protein ScalyP_jg850 [Parmales sp. scaly parma]|nr:hypothetical protein ScalyP_jg850 [Parmales sp. scaly parma]